jgi:enoyl-CoA hydratase/carnithine racemase
VIQPTTASCRAYMLAGRRLDAAAAHAAGLVLDVAADDQLLATSEDLGRRVARAPRDLVLATKRSLYEETNLGGPGDDAGGGAADVVAATGKHGRTVARAGPAAVTRGATVRSRPQRSTRPVGR